ERAADQSPPAEAIYCQRLVSEEIYEISELVHVGIIRNPVCLPSNWQLKFVIRLPGQAGQEVDH
ncbi:MAG: hypothetical protein AAF404_12915, partial [Pseudomonadota bacterium]